MSGPTPPENNPTPPPFANSYPLPDDQLAAETQLIDTFRARFPEAQLIIEEALAEIGRYTGSGVPKYQVMESEQEAVIKAGFADEDGYVSTSKVPWFSKLVLKTPINRKDQEWEMLSEKERVVAKLTDDGMRIVGNMPPETHAMLEGIYKLVGAKVVRDDRLGGETQGKVVRQGEYHGVAVHIVEVFNDVPSHNAGPSFAVEIVDDDMARQSLDELTISEAEEFLRVSGIKTDYDDAILAHGVNRENFREIANVLGQLRDVVSDVEKDRRATRVARGIGKFLGKR